MKNWYAVYVRPRSEKKVAEGLAEAGIEHFLPLLRTLRRWSDRKKWVNMPLIPGYCFVYISQNEQLHVLKVTHVLAFVKFNGIPAIIPDDQIEFLQRMLKQREVAFQLAEEMPRPGQKVEIIAGPFIGLQAEIVKTKRKSTIYLRIEQLQNAFMLEIPMDHVAVHSDSLQV